MGVVGFHGDGLVPGYVVDAMVVSGLDASKPGDKVPRHFRPTARIRRCKRRCNLLGGGETFQYLAVSRCYFVHSDLLSRLNLTLELEYFFEDLGLLRRLLLSELLDENFFLDDLFLGLQFCFYGGVDNGLREGLRLKCGTQGIIDVEFGRKTWLSR